MSIAPFSREARNEAKNGLYSLDSDYRRRSGTRTRLAGLWYGVDEFEEQVQRQSANSKLS